MEKKNLKYMMHRCMTVLAVLAAVCLTACEEMTDETYTDVEMVIPAESASFSYTTSVLKEYTLLMVNEIEFHPNLEPLGIQVGEIRFYVDDHMVTSFTHATNNYFEYKMKNLSDGEHTIRMEYELSGEGFLPGTGVIEKELKLSDVSHPRLYVDMLSFDDKTFINTDTIDFTYYSGYKDMTVSNMQYYIDGTLVATDKEHPFTFRGFTDRLDYGDHKLKVQYDVTTPGGITAAHSVETTVKADTLYAGYIIPDVLSFDDKTYLDADTFDISYKLGTLKLDLAAVHYYLDGQLLKTDAEAPYSYRGFMPVLTDQEHTLTIVSDIVSETGEKATDTVETTFKADTLFAASINANAYNFDEKTYLDADTFDIPYLLGTIDLTLDAVHYYLNGQLLKTDTEAPYSYQGLIPLLTDQEHTLTLVSDIVSNTGEKATNTISKTFKPDNYMPTLYMDALNFDDRTCLKVEDVRLPYHFDRLQLGVRTMKFYVDGKLLSTDAQAPYSHYGFTDLLDETKHTLTAVYEVVTPQGETATGTIATAFTPDGNISYAYPCAVAFNEKTYLKVSDLTMPTELKDLGLTVNEMRFYLNDRLVGKDTEAPYGYDLLTDPCSGESCTFKLAYDVTAPDGSTATYTYTEPLTIRTNSVYTTIEAPSADNNDTFKVTDLSFTWEIYHCKLELMEVTYYIDGQAMKTLTAAPYTWEWTGTGLASGSHTLKTVYKVKDAAGTTATAQEEDSFYLSSY